MAGPTVDGAGLDAADAALGDRTVADTRPADRGAGGDTAIAVDAAPSEAAHLDTGLSTDGASPADVAPGDASGLADASSADAPAAADASLDAALPDAVVAVDTALPADAAAPPDTALTDVADAAIGVDQAVESCASVSCPAYATCQLDLQGQPACVCDHGLCGVSGCRPPGGCCVDQDCGSGGWVCDNNLQCSCARPLCSDGSCPITLNKGTLTHSLSSGSWGAHFAELWDLTAGDLWLSFLYDGRGMRDSGSYSTVHAYAELGVRSSGAADVNPNNQGVWFISDYEGGVGALGPDPAEPTLDIDDKLLLQRASDQSEGAYNLPSTPPAPGNNHFFWFDRDGVDPYQAAAPLAADGVTYNTSGLYKVEMHLRAVEVTQGHAFLRINGRSQGFETDGNWGTVELAPAGLTFTGDLAQLQVFWGILGFGDTHSVTFEEVQITGCP